MKKWVKILLPIICVVVVVITFVLLFDMKRKTENTVNENEVETENIVEPENVVEENTNINVVDNEENTVVEDDEPLTEEKIQKEVMSDDEDKYSENKQEKAIELVKEHWGKDDTVYFTNESVRSEEEYIVAVRSKTSTAVQNYFKVNISTGKVTIDY